ncbi:metallophosphoesterase [Haloferula sp. A504]|uniref:metallophosphoesterase n=1 Tax=Haloferula sp. A504 TaxID=3373601 RepID=UPI0031CA7E61|nr:metallophosphoesterase [Verrucomicrobiaceae bacterium E54]
MAMATGTGASVAGFRSARAARPLAIKDFPDAASGPGAGWTTVVFPDTQNYAKFAKNQPIFESMTRWVADHAKPWNIGLALHVGDLVEQNDIAVGGGRGWGDRNGAEQWASAKRALSILDDRVPVIIATGNHDYGERNAEDRRTRFNNHFSLTDNPLVADGRGRGIWIESAPNSFGARTLENAAYVITPPHGPPWVVVALEWGPRKAAVEWASQLMARPEFASHRGLLLVHSYLNDDNRRCGDHSRPGNAHWYPTGKSGDTHDGEDLWRALVKPARQIDLVFCGHVMGRHVGYRSDPNDHGRSVHQMLFNAQGLGGGSDERGNGGDGWLRLLTLRPDGHTLDVRTFSPHFLATGRDPWRRGVDHSFTLRLDPV